MKNKNLREGFTETFEPLIETSEAVKKSIDTQQNKLIKKLQDNQLALNEGLEGNRKAITSGFDKMDEVKRCDLQQLPGFEPIEEEKKEEEEEEEKEEEEEDILEKINELKNLIIKKIILWKNWLQNQTQNLKVEILKMQMNL